MLKRLAPLALAFVSVSAPALMAQEVTLRLTHVLSTTEPMHLAAERFAELVEERSAGRIAVEVFPAGQLGTNLDMYEQVRLGAPIVQISDPGYLSDYMPDFGVLNGPYLLDDPANFEKLLDSDWYQAIVEQIAKEDQIWVPPNVMWIETFAALGARGETLAWPEVYSSLASGVVDAAEAPLSALWGPKLFESADTISMSGHFTPPVGTLMYTTCSITGVSVAAFTRAGLPLMAALVIALLAVTLVPGLSLFLPGLIFGS